MRSKKYWLGIAVSIVAMIGAGIWYSISQHNLSGINNSAAFEIQVESKVQAAEKIMKEKPEEALVIVNAFKDKPQTALIFDGMPERKVLQQVLAVLKKHQVKAVFFVEGQNAFEQPELTKLIVNDGHRIGGYTFIGISQLDKLPQEKILLDVCRTQLAIESAIGSKSELFRAAQTNYTPQLLTCLKAGGVSYAVKSNVNIGRDAIHNHNDADKLADNIMSGSIIAVQLGVSVEQKSYAGGKLDARPAIDKKPTMEAENKALTKTAEVNVAKQVDWLLSSLERRGLKVVLVDEFRKIKYVPNDITVQ